MSALPPKADIRPRDQDVCFGPKHKQPRTANKGDSGLITEVTGEFSARSCDPPHPYMKNAPMAQKFCDQRCKTTFATVSANNGLMQRSKKTAIRSPRRRGLVARMARSDQAPWRS